ncbi:hypothetical protein ACHAP5_005926 [Fusarium lateritium]
MSSQTNKKKAPTSILKGSSNNPSQTSEAEPKPKSNVTFTSENDTVIPIPAIDHGYPVMHLRDCPKSKLFIEGFSTVWVKTPPIERGVVVPKEDNTSRDWEVVAPRGEFTYDELMALPDDERAMVILTEPFETTVKRLRDHRENSE